MSNPASFKAIYSNFIYTLRKQRFCLFANLGTFVVFDLQSCVGCGAGGIQFM